MKKLLLFLLAFALPSFAADVRVAADGTVYVKRLGQDDLKLLKKSGTTTTIDGSLSVTEQINSTDLTMLNTSNAWANIKSFKRKTFAYYV